MALGGGIFGNENKSLPGSYINVVSSTNAAKAVGTRGIVAIPIEFSWGQEGSVFTVENEDFATVALKTFGYQYEDSKLKGIRDLFLNATKVHFFRLINGGVKATCDFGTAKHKGTRGNDLQLVIAVNVDDPTKFDVTTMLSTLEIETQTVANATELLDNDFVDFNNGATLLATAGISLTGGTNGDDVTGTEYQAALDAFESVSFDVLGCLSVTDTIKDVFVEYTKRLRDENGVKFQTVLYRRETADYEGVISVENTVSDSEELAASLVYWVCGVSASVAIHESITNRLYSGEFTPDVNYTQSALETAINAGKLMFHSVGDTIRLLSDINTLITFSTEKTSDFSNNQTIRVVDQVANDIATLFNTKYLGLKPNDAASRIGLWGDIVKHHNELEATGAIENFSSSDVLVEQGDDKKSVVVTDYITPLYAMNQLYMTVVVQ